MGKETLDEREEARSGAAEQRQDNEGRFARPEEAPQADQCPLGSSHRCGFA
jgi:hypothetical protein